MANELSVTGSFSFAKNGITAFARAVTAKLVSVTGNGLEYNVLSIATSETALQLGGLVAPFGWGWFHNLDATNYVEIKTVASGKIFTKLRALEFAMLPLGSDVTIPVAVANTAACLLEYALLPP